jgi:hypothetical protein
MLSEKAWGCLTQTQNKIESEEEETLTDEDRKVDQNRTDQSGRQVSQAGQGQLRAELIENRAG